VFETKSRWRWFAPPAVVYILFVAGGIIPMVDDEPEKLAIKAALATIVLFAAIRGTVRRGILMPLGRFLIAGLGFAVVGLFGSTDISIAVNKIDGAIICAAIVAIAVYSAQTRYGEERFYAAFAYFSLFVLFATLTYKVQNGFFDRQVRFFLNGPIVYGWLMGFSALISFHLWNRTREKIWAFLCICFVAALLWTESKGSAIAFLVAISSYCLMTFRGSFRFWVPLLLILFVVWIFFGESISNLFEESRFAAIARIARGDLGEFDDGSVGIRSALADYASALFWQNPLTGIGLGNFSYEGFIYPHNQHLEVFVELGVFAGFVHIFFVFIAWFRADVLGRSLILMFSVSSMFSGDISYLRFLYAYCLLAIFQFSLRETGISQRGSTMAMRSI